MQVESFAIRLRQRSPLEAADMGVRLCQDSAASLFKCYLLVALPIIVFALAGFEIAPWIPVTSIWLAKPWLDRTILFVLARAAFGQATTIRDLWQAQRQVWWGQFLRTWTTRQFSPWRSFTQPVYQLEGLRGAKLRKRVRQIRSGNWSSAWLMTMAFNFTELAITFTLLLLAVFFAPKGYLPDIWQVATGEYAPLIPFAYALAYSVAVIVVEPFYVGAGFAIYLNRRVDLEAWDIEQEFRRSNFARATT